MHEQAAAAIAHVGTTWSSLPEDLFRQALRIKAAVLLRAGNHRVRRETCAQRLQTGAGCRRGAQELLADVAASGAGMSCQIKRNA